MKRIIAALLCALLCLGGCALAESASAFELSDVLENKPQTITAEIYYVRARKLNVRTGPDEFYPVIAKLKKYSRVYVTGEDGEWYKLWNDGEIGYVKKMYLRHGGKTETIEIP